MPLSRIFFAGMSWQAGATAPTSSERAGPREQSAELRCGPFGYRKNSRNKLDFQRRTQHDAAPIQELYPISIDNLDKALTQPKFRVPRRIKAPVSGAQPLHN